MSMKPNVWNPDEYARNARYVSDLGMPVLELLNPRPGERILDLGCGDGELTRVLRDRGCEPVGIDSSGEFIAAAQTLGLDVREQEPANWNSRMNLMRCSAMPCFTG